MKAEIKTITPEYAKELLKMNIGNRRLKTIKNSYVGQMLNGEWKENGEPIIIDVNGFIKDGQHRLHACIEANYSWDCPIISGVSPDVMDTIDTGANRSLQDVLQLNGYTDCAVLSSLARAICTYNSGKNAFSQVSGISSGSYKKYFSNNKGLNYVNENKDDLIKLVRVITRVYVQNKIKVLTTKDLGLILYVISDYEIKQIHIDFLKHISGAVVNENSCTSWLYKKLLTAKLNKNSINNDWKFQAVIKAWNIFSDGDYAVNYLRVNKDEKQKINKV